MHLFLRTAAAILMTVGAIGTISCLIALFVLKRTGDDDAEDNA